jgi:hypothetical protein
MTMTEICDGEKCDENAAYFCRECLEEFILAAVAKALKSNLAALETYHQNKRRFRETPCEP